MPTEFGPGAQIRYHELDDQVRGEDPSQLFLRYQTLCRESGISLDLSRCVIIPKSLHDLLSGVTELGLCVEGVGEDDQEVPLDDRGARRIPLSRIGVDPADMSSLFRLIGQQNREAEARYPIVLGEVREMITNRQQQDSEAYMLFYPYPVRFDSQLSKLLRRLATDTGITVVALGYERETYRGFEELFYSFLTMSPENTREK